MRYFSEKNTEKKLSKLQSEVHLHKSNLEKRKNYCDRLTQKMKQTEGRLMKYLAVRQREIAERASKIHSTKSQYCQTATEISRLPNWLQNSQDVSGLRRTRRRMPRNGVAPASHANVLVALCLPRERNADAAKSSNEQFSFCPAKLLLS